MLPVCGTGLRPFKVVKNKSVKSSRELKNNDNEIIQNKVVRAADVIKELSLHLYSLKLLVF